MFDIVAVDVQIQPTAIHPFVHPLALALALAFELLLHLRTWPMCDEKED